MNRLILGAAITAALILTAPAAASVVRVTIDSKLVDGKVHRMVLLPKAKRYTLRVHRPTKALHARASFHHTCTTVTYVFLNQGVDHKYVGVAWHLGRRYRVYWWWSPLGTRHTYSNYCP